MTRTSGAPRRQWVLSTAVVLLGVLPLAGVALLVEKRATAAVRNDARDSLMGTSKLTAGFLDEQLRGIKDITESYARRQLLLRALERPGGPDTAELTRHLTELRDSRPDVLNVTGIADLSGVMIAGTVMPPPHANFKQRDWFRGVMRTNRTYVSEAIVGTSPGSPLAVAIGSPVRDRDGQLIAIIVAGYTLENIQKFIAGFAATQRVELTVTDQRGVTLAQPGAAPTQLISSMDNPLVSAALAGREGVRETRDARDRHLLSAYTPVPDVGWAVRAEQPTSQAYAPVHDLRRQVVVTTVAFMGLLLLGAALLIRTLRSRDAAWSHSAWLASLNTAILDAAEEGVTLVDPDATPLVRNAQTKEIGAELGLDPGAPIYDEMRRVAPLMADPEAFAALADALSTDPDRETTEEFTLTKTGRSFHLYTRPLRSDDGELLGRLFVTRETTADRRAQDAVLQARDEAELANAAKTEFLTRMSHELRTPLHAILGFGELLGREELTHRQREHLAQIVSGGRHLLSLINEVLDLSRVERGELSVSIEPVLASEVVHETLALTRPLADAREVSITAPSSADLRVHVLADRQRLKQVLLNLVSNAAKYTQRGGTVTITCVETATGSLRIAVTDNGPGIAPDQLPKVFTQFQRLGAEATAVEGSGLGLSLSKRLVETMGGRIGVDTEVGRGSTFWLELAITEPPFVRSDAPAAAGHERRRVRRPASSVLLVEDNPAGVKLMQTILSQRPGVELLVAQNGNAALELARSQRPELVLLDVNLPDISGAVVLHALRSDPRTSGIPVVMVSADATPGEVKRLMAAGADDYLTKPFTVESLLAVLDGVQATPGQPGPEAVLDLDTVRSLQQLATSPGLVPGALDDLVEAYLHDAAERVARLRISVAARNVEVTVAEAHTLRGGSAGLGALAVVALCQEIEGAARADDFAVAQTAVDKLPDAVDAATRQLERAFSRQPEPH